MCNYNNNNITNINIKYLHNTVFIVIYYLHAQYRLINTLFDDALDSMTRYGLTHQSENQVKKVSKRKHDREGESSQLPPNSLVPLNSSSRPATPTNRRRPATCLHILFMPLFLSERSRRAVDDFQRRRFSRAAWQRPFLSLCVRENTRKARIGPEGRSTVPLPLSFLFGRVSISSEHSSRLDR